MPGIRIQSAQTREKLYKRLPDGTIRRAEFLCGITTTDLGYWLTKGWRPQSELPESEAAGGHEQPVTTQPPVVSFEPKKPVAKKRRGRPPKRKPRESVSKDGETQDDQANLRAGGDAS